MKKIGDHDPARRGQRALGKKDTPEWKNQEARLAKATGGRLQPGSGAGPVEKGDVQTSNLLIEAKATGKKSLSVKLEWLVKITREATALAGRIPALAITFEDTPIEVEKDWILLPKSAFLALTEDG